MLKQYTVERLLKSLKINPAGFPDALLKKEISGVSTDSRTIKRNSVFFALRGERFDGADYVENALESGVLCSVVNKDSVKTEHRELPVIPVGDTLRALGDTARDYRCLFEGKVIALTGTNGKTTSREMMLSVLKSRWRVHGTRDNFNNHIGLPLSVFGLDDTHECAVFELGMNAPGEISYLGGIVQPHIGVILNIGPGHLEFFSDINAVADAKMELLNTLDKNGKAVINGDDELLKPSELHSPCPVVKFGINNQADYHAENVEIHPDGCASYYIDGHRVMLKVPGMHNVYNTLAAYAVGRLMDVEAKQAVESLERFTAPSMRMQIVKKNGVSFIDDSYNANPFSMEGAAEVLRSIEITEENRKIAVLGDMLELGRFSEELHVRIGNLFGSMGLEWLCFAGKYTSLYYHGACEGGMNPEKIRSFKDAESAALFINEIKRPGDLILVKGSRAVGMEKILKLTDGVE
ncbi:UDP-N-acetylmuramoyl-tripeptide--D-alanyl-D-alanine ligase [Candidatus Latescibacterota bacterium]